jgi:hypothetical protein
MQGIKVRTSVIPLHLKGEISSHWTTRQKKLLVFVTAYFFFPLLHYKVLELEHCQLLCSTKIIVTHNNMSHTTCPYQGPHLRWLAAPTQYYVATVLHSPEENQLSLRDGKAEEVS